MTRLAAGPCAYDFSADGRLRRAASPARAWEMEGAVIGVRGADGTDVDLALTVEEDAPGLLLRGEASGVALRCRIEAEGGLAVWRMEVANRGRIPISDVTLPLLRISDPPADWRCTVPYSTGWVTGPPWLPPGSRIDAVYPTPLSMQWVDLYTTHAGLFAGWRDARALRKRLRIARARDAVELSWTLEGVDIAPGETYEAPEFVLAAHDGDWQAGAAIYRAWADEALAPCECPDWFRRDPHWCWVGMKGQHAAHARRRFEDIPGASSALAGLGVRTLHLASYFEDGHDTGYPFFRAGAAQGGEDALRRAIADLQRAGRRIALYTNGRLFDPAGPLSRMHPEWRGWAVRRSEPGEEVLPGDETGLVATDTYGDVTFAVMCPSAPPWRKLLSQRVVEVMRRYGPDGVYVDQVCCADSLLCQADDHGHARPAEAWAGYIELIRDIREGVKAANAEAYMATEGVCDVTGQYFDVFQSHNDWSGPVGSKAVPLPALFRACLPDRVIVAGPTIPGADHLLAIAHALLGGYDCVGLAEPATPAAQKENVRDVLSWRDAFADAIRSADVLPAPACSSESVCAVAVRGEGRAVIAGGWVPWPPEAPPEPPEVVRLVVATDARGPVALHRPGHRPELIDATRHAGSLTCEVPFSPIFTLTIDDA